MLHKSLPKDSPFVAYRGVKFLRDQSHPRRGAPHCFKCEKPLIYIGLLDNDSFHCSCDFEGTEFTLGELNDVMEEALRIAGESS